MGLKVLVLGGGGREHALVWKLQQSPRISQVVCAPGNGGIAADAECLAVDLSDVESVAALAGRLLPDLTVVGPELPLSLGVVDEFNRRSLPIFGPSRRAARLESSKAFARGFMQRHNIPGPHYAICGTPAEVASALPLFSAPLVVKADGLAAGKGVVIAPTREAAAFVAAEMLSGTTVGQAGTQVVLEEFLKGDELSFLVLCDGERAAPLGVARDYKRAGDGDTGANTGGMGAYSTASMVEPEMVEWLLQHVACPVIEGMKAEETEYRGILYCGLMMTARGPMVLEFNCRFGDPETQAILMRLDSDLLEAMQASIEGRVSAGDFVWSPEASACVVLASEGYPEKFEAGKKISGLETLTRTDGLKVFHAATEMKDGEFYTTGGRVLGVTARGADLATAVQRAYEAAAQIRFDGMHYRKDIGGAPLKAAG